MREKFSLVRWNLVIARTARVRASGTTTAFFHRPSCYLGGKADSQLLVGYATFVRSGKAKGRCVASAFCSRTFLAVHFLPHLTSQVFAGQQKQYVSAKSVRAYPCSLLARGVHRSFCSHRRISAQLLLTIFAFRSDRTENLLSYSLLKLDLTSSSDPIDRSILHFAPPYRLVHTSDCKLKLLPSNQSELN